MKLITLTALLMLGLAVSGAASATADDAAPNLKETRLTLDKWIDTQQIISKERKDWQQGKEILQSRLEIVKKEIAVLEGKTGENKAVVSESEVEHQNLETENALLVEASQQLSEAVTAMEREVRRLFGLLPAPLQDKLAPLYERVPENPETTRVAVAERYQNVLGILNELNKANSEILVNYEIHAMPDGKSAEVKAIYVGLAQAYYVSARGEGGIGRPGPDGWTWEASDDVAPHVVTALEILEGKQSPTFVPLPIAVQ